MLIRIATSPPRRGPRNDDRETFDKTYTIVYGVYVMKRYQVYLDPATVSILDDFEESSRLSRSQLIRLSIDRLAENLSKVFIAQKVKPSRRYVLDSLSGVIKTRSRETNFAQRPDRRYLQD